ncbi:unnamed protein product [Amoebophrya sp. A120]|nr:unnamed protein product [Amoebophrya sp. A120]|eukprot:GSA120T00014262001.1
MTHFSRTFRYLSRERPTRLVRSCTTTTTSAARGGSVHDLTTRVKTVLCSVRAFTAANNATSSTKNSSTGHDHLHGRYNKESEQSLFSTSSATPAAPASSPSLFPPAFAPPDDADRGHDVGQRRVDLDKQTQVEPRHHQHPKFSSGVPTPKLTEKQLKGTIATTSASSSPLDSCAGGTGGILRKLFYEKVTIVGSAAAAASSSASSKKVYKIFLEDRELKTSNNKVLEIPSLELAKLVQREWLSQIEEQEDKVEDNKVEGDHLQKAHKVEAEQNKPLPHAGRGMKMEARSCISPSVSERGDDVESRSASSTSSRKKKLDKMAVRIKPDTMPFHTLLCTAIDQITPLSDHDVTEQVVASENESTTWPATSSTAVTSRTGAASSPSCASSTLSPFVEEVDRVLKYLESDTILFTLDDDSTSTSDSISAEGGNSTSDCSSAEDQTQMTSNESSTSSSISTTFSTTNHRQLAEKMAQQWTPMRKKFCEKYGVHVQPFANTLNILAEDESTAVNEKAILQMRDRLLLGVKEEVVKDDHAAAVGDVYLENTTTVRQSTCMSHWKLTALTVAVQNLKSFILAQLLVDDEISVEKALECSMLEEYHQREFWGDDGMWLDLLSGFLSICSCSCPVVVVWQRVVLHDVLHLAVFSTPGDVVARSHVYSSRMHVHVVHFVRGHEIGKSHQVFHTIDNPSFEEQRQSQLLWLQACQQFAKLMP